MYTELRSHSFWLTQRIHDEESVIEGRHKHFIVEIHHVADGWIRVILGITNSIEFIYGSD